MFLCNASVAAWVLPGAEPLGGKAQQRNRIVQSQNQGPLHCLLCWAGSKLVLSSGIASSTEILDLWVAAATLKAVLYWSFKPRTAAKHCHSIPTSLSRLRTHPLEHGTVGARLTMSSTPSFPGSMLPWNTTQPPKRMHPIYLSLSTDNLRCLVGASATKYSLNWSPISNFL